MKKNFLSLGLIAAAAFTLTNCTQEIANPVEPSVDGVPFEIVASPAETKTTNNGMSTVWADGDAINLFHAEAGEKTYVSDGQFTLTSENTFKGTLNGTLVESYNYDWFAFYPYSKYVTTPASRTSGYMPVGSYSNSSQTQEGNSSMSHIAGSYYPLAGKLLDTEYEAGTPVSITMSHLTSLLEVVVTNTSDEDLTVTNVSFTAPESVVGTYYIDFTGEAPVFTPRGDSYVSKTASLKVTNGAAISKNASAKFYLAVKPFIAAAGKTLTLSVNGYSKEVTVPSDMTFAPGQIKTLNFNYNKQTAAGEYTINWSSANDWVEKATKYVSGYYTIKTAKNSSSTDPTVNASDNDCRVYAMGGLTISHSAGVNIQKIVFNVSQNGKKRLTEITASTGSVTVDATNYKVIWEGSASSVTFTVGEKATYGTDGTDKAGQLCFDSIDVIAEPSSAPYIPVLKSIELNGMTTEYNVGDTFRFDGTVTANYYNQDSKTVNPTKVTEPSMAKGNHTVKVEYTEDGVTVDASYNILVNDPNEVVGETLVETITFSSLGYENATAVTEVKSGDVTITFNKGSNSNAPKYYTSGNALRTYGGNYFTISAGTNVTKVEFTFSSGEGTNAITADSGNYASNAWSGKSSSVKFSIGGSSGHRRIAKIVVTYEK